MPYVKIPIEQQNKGLTRSVDCNSDKGNEQIPESREFFCSIGGIGIAKIRDFWYDSCQEKHVEPKKMHFALSER